MTRDNEIRNKLREYGCRPFVFAENNSVVYIPRTFCEDNPEKIQELSLKRRIDDTFLTPMRSVNMKKDLLAFDI